MQVSTPTPWGCARSEPSLLFRGDGGGSKRDISTRSFLHGALPGGPCPFVLEACLCPAGLPTSLHVSLLHAGPVPLEKQVLGLLGAEAPGFGRPAGCGVFSMSREGLKAFLKEFPRGSGIKCHPDLLLVLLRSTIAPSLCFPSLSEEEEGSARGWCRRWGWRRARPVSVPACVCQSMPVSVPARVCQSLPTSVSPCPPMGPARAPAFPRRGMCLLPCPSLRPESPRRGWHTRHRQGPILPACREAGERAGQRHSRQAARLELGMEAGTVHAIHVVFCFLIPSLHAEKKRG